MEKYLPRPSLNIGLESSEDLILHKYRGRSQSCSADDLDPDDKTALMRRVHENIHRFYEEGVKFFDKRILRDLVTQLEDVRKGDRSPGSQKVVVPGLNGEQVQVDVETGNILGNPDADTEWVVGEPMLSYRTYQHLACFADPGYSFSNLPYFPIQVNYHVQQRRKSTLELVTFKTPNQVEDVRRKFAESISLWEQTDTCKTLRSKLRKTSTPRVTKIVAFACSSMAYCTKEPSNSMLQHALILTLRDVLQTKGSQEGAAIDCVAQDPMYTDSDKIVLLEHGIRVVDDPVAFLEVDDESAVLSFYPNIPVRQIVADIARPAMMIWNKILTLEEAKGIKKTDNIDVLSGDGTDPQSSRLTEMMEEYDTLMSMDDQKEFGWCMAYVKKH